MFLLDRSGWVQNYAAGKVLLRTSLLCAQSLGGLTTHVRAAPVPALWTGFRFHDGLLPASAFGGAEDGALPES